MDSPEEIHERVSKIGSQKLPYLYSHGAAIIDAIQSTDDDYVASRDLDLEYDNMREIGHAIGALGKLYGEDLHVETDESNDRLWNVGLLREKDGLESLKAYLST